MRRSITSRFRAAAAVPGQRVAVAPSRGVGPQRRAIRELGVEARVDCRREVGVAAAPGYMSSTGRVGTADEQRRGRFPGVRFARFAQRLRFCTTYPTQHRHGVAVVGSRGVRHETLRGAARPAQHFVLERLGATRQRRAAGRLGRGSGAARRERSHLCGIQRCGVAGAAKRIDEGLFDP